MATNNRTSVTFIGCSMSQRGHEAYDIFVWYKNRSGMVNMLSFNRAGYSRFHHTTGQSSSIVFIEFVNVQIISVLVDLPSTRALKDGCNMMSF